MKTRNVSTTAITATALGLSLLAALYFFLPFTAAPDGLGQKQPEATVKAEAQTAYGKLPLHFEANQGQTDAQVKFLSRGHGYAFYLTATEAVLTLSETRRDGDTATRGETATRPSAASSHRPVASLRMQFLGANQQPQISGLAELPGKSNYFIGSDPRHWRTDVATFAKVKFGAVYPGIDVVYYGTQGRELEYDFIVAPGADPKTIKLRFAGAEKMAVDEQGDLVLQLAGKPLRLQKPVVYQAQDGARQEIASNYVHTSADEISINVADYDASKPLVIDPVLAYSTYLGGSGQDAGLEIAVNEHGSAFVTGLTTSLDFPGAANSHAGGYDAFIVKLNAAGSALVYSTYLGGSDDENAHGGVSFGGIAIDASDNAYVTGITKSQDFPATPGAFRTKLNGYADAFVSKLNAAGNALVYSTFVGGKGFDGGQAIAVDAFGQAYITGQDESGDLPIINGFAAHSTGCGSGYKDGFVAKLNAAGGALVYSTYFGGVCNLGWGIAVDAAQNAFVMGETLSPGLATPNAFDTVCGTDGACNGLADIFVAKINTTVGGFASKNYFAYLGGSGEDRVTYSGGIAVDAAGQFVYVTGGTASVAPADFPIKNAAQPLPNGPYDAFITKLEPAVAPGAQLIYSTYLGGGGGDFGAGIAVDILGNAYVAGSSGGTFPSTGGMPTCTDPGAIIVKLNAAGQIKYAGCISGALGQDSGLDVAVDPAGSAYITGFSESSYFPLVNPLQPIFAGGGTPPSDGFVAKFSEGLDHFKCYDVRAHENFHPFEVRLGDQFEKQDVTVLRPTTLCNPVVKCVGKDCTPVLNPDAHLVCYETKDEQGTPQFERREVIVSNQFGKEQRLTVWRRKNLLCVPSLKAHADNR